MDIYGDKKRSKKSDEITGGFESKDIKSTLRFFSIRMNSRPHHQPPYRIVILFTLWLSCNLVYTFVFRTENTTLLSTVSHELAIPIASACVILVMYMMIFKGGRDAGFATPNFRGAWILIFPGFIISLQTIYLVTVGALDNPVSYYWIFINTMLAGFSEELMFRGYILTALVKRATFLRAVILSAGLFGSVHLLNYFTTGNLVASVAQSLLAASSGLLFIAIRMKTGSLFPAIIVHGLFDFVAMMKLVPSADPSNAFTLIAGVLLAISPFVFGITGAIQLSRKKDREVFLATIR